MQRNKIDGQRKNRGKMPAVDIGSYDLVIINVITVMLEKANIHQCMTFLKAKFTKEKLN